MKFDGFRLLLMCAVVATASARPWAQEPPATSTHWAYAPLLAPEVPQVSDASWPANAIDRFVSARLERAGLRPAPRADARTLLRRTYFVLAGLAPSPTDAAAFLRDPTPQVFADLVDRLLSSKLFGERWGRHWLDLARYADSNGLDENFLFREAWRYRNWVIDAVNRDVP
ncbi:MAG: DUF1549 domain-containing protein, partial [Planctomycetota bacterium]